MTNVKNISTGPRGIHTTDRGLVMLEAGESDELDLAKGEDNEEWFSFGKTAKASPDKSAAPKDLTPPVGGELPGNVMKLKSIAKAENIDLGEAKSAADIKVKITAYRDARAALVAEAEAAEVEIEAGASNDDIRAAIDLAREDRGGE